MHWYLATIVSLHVVTTACLVGNMWSNFSAGLPGWLLRLIDYCIFLLIRLGLWLRSLLSALVLILFVNEWFVLDVSDCFNQHMINTSLSTFQISNIFIYYRWGSDLHSLIEPAIHDSTTRFVNMWTTLRLFWQHPITSFQRFVLRNFGMVWINLIKTIIIPLIFFTDLSEHYIPTREHIIFHIS